jgi:hypothetical protein
MMKKLRDQKGFTLLLAALVASIVLSLGSSIFLIAKKQVTLSSLGRDSQFAFYAADTGAECALYWDIRHSAFGATAPASATCDGIAMNQVVTSGTRDAAPYEITFQMDLFTNSSPGFCVQVHVRKNTTSPFTVIDADGYSTPCAGIELSARALQRSVQFQY